MAKDEIAPASVPVFGNDGPELIAPLTRGADGKLSVVDVVMASVKADIARAHETERDVHAVLAHMESELLNLPDYATARFKALVAELKAKL